MFLYGPRFPKLPVAHHSVCVGGKWLAQQNCPRGAEIKTVRCMVHFGRGGGCRRHIRDLRNHPVISGLPSISSWAS